jgi:hypothetical protein
MYRIYRIWKFTLDLSQISKIQQLLAVRFCCRQNLPLLAMVVADPPPAEMSELMAAGEESSTNGQQLYQYSLHPENPACPVGPKDRTGVNPV